MIFEIVRNNYACLLVCLLFFIFVATDRSFDSRTALLFLVTIGIAFFLTVIDNLEWIQSLLPAPTLARKLCAAFGYLLRPATAITVILILHRNHPGKHKGLIRYFLLLPLVFNSIVSLLSIANGCVFRYSADNLFSRGPLGLVPFFTGLFYVGYLLYSSLAGMKSRAKAETALVCVIAFLCISGTMMEAAFHFRGTFNTAVSIGTAFYYLYLHVTIYSVDQLTGALNRRIFYLDIKKIKKGEEIILVCLDLNNLKHINDTQGHAAGDRALSALTGTIRKSLLRGCTLYRMGGDEFTVLCRRLRMPQVQSMMQAIQTALQATPYTFAYGFACYRDGEDINAAYNKADQAMYAMKKDMKTGETAGSINSDWSIS